MVSGLAEKIKELRIKAGYTQKEVAQLVSVSPSIVSAYEKAERSPSFEVLVRLASLYRCSTDYLLGVEKQEPKRVLEVEGLTDEQILLLERLIQSMKKI